MWRQLEHIYGRYNTAPGVWLCPKELGETFLHVACREEGLRLRYGAY